MLSKCANPNCSNTFRYLHEGKLYLIGSRPANAKRNGSSRHATEFSAPEYAWLCSTCCRHMSIRFDQKRGAVVVCKSEPLVDKQFGLH